MTQPPISVSGRPALEVALATARGAGELVKGRFYTAKEVSYKDNSSLVTDVDLLAEKYIRDALAREFPDISYLGEELGASGGTDGLHWIVDPVDGTRNYAANVPHFAVSLALADGPEVLLGVTYDPMRDETFHAAKGQGTFLNGRPISVSRRTSVAQSIVGFDIGGMDSRALYAFKMVRALWPGMQTVRIMGSSCLGLAYAAAGRVDIYFHHTLAPWDVAAGLLLVGEAGGQVVDRKSRGPANLGSTGLVASSPQLLKEFLRLTRDQEWYRVD